MDNPIFNSLVYNASLLLAMVFIFHLITPFSRAKTFLWQITVGLILGIIGIAVMETNWEFVSGIIFDTRTVLLGVTGLFFGLIPTLIVILIDVVYRISLGGSGMLMGVATILESALIGLIWRRFRVQKLSTISMWELYLLGLVIHLVMLVMTWLLPSEIRGQVLSGIWMPVIIIYPVATAIVGLLMSSRLKVAIRSREALEREQKARALFDLSFEFIGLMTPEGILLDVNQTALDFVGAKHSEVVGEAFWNTPWWSYTKETRDQIKQAIRVAASGQLVHEETTHRAKDGTIHIIDFTVKPVFNEFKKVISLIPEGRDVTDQKRSEASLRESEYFFRESQRAANIGSYKTDFLTGMWESSKVLDQIFGIKKNYHRSVQGWLNLVYPEDKKMMSKHLNEEVLGKHSPFNKEYRIVRPSDGRIRWVQGLGKVGLGLKGKVISMIGTIQDITARKEIEIKLKELSDEILSEKQKMEAILRDMGDAVFVTDHEKNIILVNKALELLFGLSREELLGKNITEALTLSYESSGKKPEDILNTVFEKKIQAKPAETLVLNKKDGSRLLVDGIASPITDESKKLVGTVWVFRDVTKEREIDKMKTDFVSLASHQLRSPLTGIKWFIELLTSDKSKIPPEKVQEYLRNIGKSNERLIALVSDLLITAKIESGEVKRVTTDCSLRGLLQDALDDQKVILQDKNTTVMGLEKIPFEWKVEVDSVQLTQVFGNLINNAASYSPEGSQIELEAELQAGQVKVFVKDCGLGIPAAQQAKIFNKFYRGDNVAKTTAGSGLGLYIAKNVVENHCGKIWFESEEGKGTTFFVELPEKQPNNASNP